MCTQTDSRKHNVGAASVYYEDPEEVSVRSQLTFLGICAHVLCKTSPTWEWVEAVRVLHSDWGCILKLRLTSDCTEQKKPRHWQTGCQSRCCLLWGNWGGCDDRSGDQQLLLSQGQHEIFKLLTLHFIFSPQPSEWDAAHHRQTLLTVTGG